MIYREVNGAVFCMRETRLERPLGVALVGLLQFIKASVLLVASAMLCFHSSSVTDTQSALYPLLFVALRGNTSAIAAASQGGMLLAGIVGLLGLYMGATALGLWKMKDSARKVVRLACGVTVFLYVKATLFPGPIVALSSAPEMLKLHMLITLDALVFAYLLRGDTADWFKRRPAVQFVA